MALNGYNYHYTTDSMTARQRAALEQGRRYTHDETGKLHYTEPNGARPDVQTPRSNDLHIHIHDGSEDDPASPEGIAARRPAMREPGLDPNNEVLADVQEQLADLNIAVARMAQGQGMGLSDDPDQVGEGEVNQFPDDPSDPGDILSQMASRSANSTDAGPPTPAAINEANRAMWNTPGRTTTGMGNHPPNSRAAESGSYMPNQAGSMNGNRRMSTVAENGKMMGKTSGWGTSDMAMQDRAQFWREQRVQTNSAIAKINRRNAAARQRAGWGV